MAVLGPGVMCNNVAYQQKVNGVLLHDLIQSLPAGYYVVADAAYTPTEHLVSVVGGVEAHNPRYDAFNYVVSQCRIRIEMSFGLMCKKWGIFWHLCHMNMSNYKVMVGAMARIHNFCIDERLQAGMPAVAYNHVDLAFESVISLQREESAEQEYREHQQYSWIPSQFKFRRELLADKIYFDEGIRQPIHSIHHMQESSI